MNWGKGNRFGGKGMGKASLAGNVLGKKYGNIKAKLDGYSFGSMLEGMVYLILKDRARKGEIEILQLQDHVYLSDAEIEYIPDFKCRDLKTGEEFWVEAKGYANEKWPIKKKLWRYYGPGKLEIWMGTHDSPYLKEVIVPKVRKTTVEHHA